MNEKTKSNIEVFFSAVKELQHENVITTKKYPLDIYGFIAKEYLDYQKDEIFTNNCPHSHPCRITVNEKVNEILVVLGPLSNLKRELSENEIHYFYIQTSDIKKYLKSKKSVNALFSDFFKDKSPSYIYYLT